MNSNPVPPFPRVFQASKSIAQELEGEPLKAKLDAIPGELHSSERLFLYAVAADIAKTKRNLRIFNIGVLHGLSCFCFREGAPDAEIVGIDIVGDEKLVKLDGWDTFEIIKADSTTFEYGKWIDLLFIDGDHETPSVEKDIFQYCPNVVPEGIVIFHDARGRGKWESKVSDAIDNALPLTGTWMEATYMLGRIVGVMRWFIRVP